MELYSAEYSKLTERRQLFYLRQQPIKGSGAPDVKMVQFDDDRPLPYVKGENGEYYRNGLPLTSVLQTAANGGRSKVKIF